MKNKVLALGLSLGMVFGGASPAFAQETTREDFIKQAEEKVSKAEEEHKKVKKAYDDFKSQYSNYINDKGQFILTDESVANRLKRAGDALDQMVANKIPSIESANLQVKFAQGYEDENHKIKELNAYDLLEYVNSIFNIKAGVNPEDYKKAMVEYVNAISDSVILPNLKRADDYLKTELKRSENYLTLTKYDLSLAKGEGVGSLIERLENAIYDAETSLKSAKSLIEIAPKTVAPVRHKLDKLIEKQENTIELSRKVLETLKTPR